MRSSHTLQMADCLVTCSVILSEYTGAATMDTVRESTQHLVLNRCMLVCLRCQCLAHLELHDIHELAMGGKFYNSALHELGELNVDKCYTFKDLGMLFFSFQIVDLRCI